MYSLQSRSDKLTRLSPGASQAAVSETARRRRRAAIEKAKADQVVAYKQPEGFEGAHGSAADILKARGVSGVRNVRANALQRYKENKSKYAAFKQGNVTGREMNPHLAQLVDFDGDGNVDAEEYALMAEVQDAELKDLDGDGVIDEDEAIVAKVELGKSIIAKRFVASQQGRMWKFGEQFRDAATGKSMPDGACAKLISEHKYFGPQMNWLKQKDRIYRLSSSDGMRRSLVSPITGRPLVFTPRPSVLSNFL
eukprot:g7210.t1